MRTRLFGEVIDSVPRGMHRAMALNLLAGMQIHLNSFAKAVEMLKEALDNAGDHLEVRVRTMLLLSFAEINAGEFVHAMQHSERAVILAEGVDNPDLTSQVLSMRAMVTSMCGNGFDASGLRRANALENPDSDAPIALRASATYAVLMSWAGRWMRPPSRCRSCAAAVPTAAPKPTSYSSRTSRTLIEVWRGRYAEATSVAEETVERAEQLGGDHLQVVGMTVRAVVGAYTGRESETREAALGAIARAAVRFPAAGRLVVDQPGVPGGFAGNYAEALTALEPLIARFDQVPGTEIVTSGYVPDAVAALVSLGRLDEAEPLIDAIEANGRWLDRPWMLAVGAKCRSRLLAARGDVTGAIGMAEMALAHHDRLPMPFERARTLLLLGQLQRRQRKKDTARATLGAALEAFEALGTPLWADRARAELARTSGVPSRRPRADAVRTAGGRARGLGNDDPCRRRGAVHQPEDRRIHPGPHLPQARHQVPRRTWPPHRRRRIGAHPP